MKVAISPHFRNFFLCQKSPFVKILANSLTIFEANFWEGICTFDFQKLPSEGHKLGHFEDFWTEKVALSWRQNWHNLEIKIGSSIVEGSIESSVFRAFERDLIGKATYFHF